MTPEISVILTTHNKVELTISCLEAFIANTDDSIAYEMIIIDNVSTDATREFLQNVTGDDFTIILNDTDLGFGGSCNKAAGVARGKYLLFLSNDTNVMAGWMPTLYNLMESDNMVGAAQPRLLFPNGTLNNAGNLVFKDQEWNYGKHDPNPFGQKYSSRRGVDYVEGACLITRKSLWDDIGGFDPFYAPAYYEDTDYSFAVRDKGFKTLYEPGANVIHLEGGTHGGQESEFRQKQYKRNRAYFVEKWAEQLADHPVYSPEILDQWAHRDRGQFNP